MKLLASFDTAPESHEELERVLASGDYPLAECRVDQSTEQPYQVWSEPRPWVQTPPSEPLPPPVELRDLLREEIRAALSEALGGEQ